MRKLGSQVLVAGAALLALCGAAGTAAADPRPGAALALPYLTNGTDRITVATITNVDPAQPVTLHLNFIIGDPGQSWNALNFDCPLIPRETTYLVFEPEPGGNTRVTTECSDLGVVAPDPTATNNVFVRLVQGQTGVLFVSAECQVGEVGCTLAFPAMRTRTDDVLLGDFSVIDSAQGFAFSADALHIQGVPGAGFGDQAYAFDGSAGEYARFPSTLIGQYVAPDDDVTADLLLFTLDGRVGTGPGIDARVAGFGYDDDGNPTSASIEFDCFTITDLVGPDGFGLNLSRTFGGHLVGHLELFPIATARADAQEFSPPLGDGNGARVPVVYGYLIQTVASGGDLADGAFGGTAAATAAWAQGLASGDTALVPFGMDVPALDTNP